MIVLAMCKIGARHNLQKKIKSFTKTLSKLLEYRSLFSPFLNNTEGFTQGFNQFHYYMISYTAMLNLPLASMGWFLNVLLQGRLGYAKCLQYF